MARWSVSFKRREEFLYEYLQEQFDPLAYFKMLVYEDMKSKGLIDAGKKVNSNEEVKSKECDSDNLEFEINF